MTPDTQTQIELERLFHKNQLMTRLRFEFRQPEIIEICTEHKLKVDFVIDLLSQMALHKRTKIAVLVGLLHRHFDESPSLTQNLQACVDMICRSAEAGLVNVDPIMHETFIIAVELKREVYDEMELYQYPLPMVVKPRILETNRETGYLTGKDSAILKSGNHHEDDICLDHLNRVNRVPLTINQETARLVKNKWRNLDHQKPDETKQEFLKRKAAFEKYDRNTKEVMEHLSIAGGKFWLTHKYDKRGRSYAQGYHVNTQGTPWNKAVVEFAETEICGGINA
jgi:DNA-directed RNA polymerase